MDSQLTNPPKPTFVNVIAWMTLASGVVNIGWGIAAFTTFFGWVCAPLSVLPIILGAFELVYAGKLLTTPTQPIKPSTSLAISEIIAILYGNFFSLVVGILALVFYNDVSVRDYFNQLNGTTSLAPVPPVPPAPIVDPAPVVEEPPSSDETPKS